MIKQIEITITLPLSFIMLELSALTCCSNIVLFYKIK